jgi:DNA-directed RNA polymerase specialized sigma24 family protein
MLPEPASDLCELVRRAQARDQDAAQKVYDLCKGPLLSAMQAVLYQKVRTKIESSEFLQEAFVVIFTTRFSDAVLRSPQGLMAYMKKIAVNKVRNVTQRLLFTQRYGITKEVSLDLQKEITNEPKELSAQDALMLQELAVEWWGAELAELPPDCKMVTKFALDHNAVRRLAAALVINPEAANRLIRQVWETLGK